MSLSDKQLRIIGLNPTGDLGDITFYTTKRRVVITYDKAPPLKPATNRQQVRRNRWRRAAEAWQLLPPSERAKWHRACRLARLHIHGYNLYVFFFSTQKASYVQTIERISRIDLI